MFRTTAAALAFGFVLGIAVTPASAAEAAAPSSSLAASAAAVLANDTDWSMPAVHMGAGPDTRGVILPGLYVGLAALNIYDAVSTKQGLAHGAIEGNPGMNSLAGSSTSLWAAKAVTTASTILISEHLWKTHHRAQAIAVMVISNGIMSAVAAHNASVLHSAVR
jgi:Domain of unknown function (DUF5658)